MFKHYRLMTALLVSVAVAGCSGGEKAKTESQVVAKVNDVEITVHQLNFALQRMGPMNEAQSKEASKKVLRALVEQEMLVQKAVAAKLDRDPQVVQALEFSRRQLLAQTYMSRQAKEQKPSEKEVLAYYKQHPEFFEQRRVYRLQELTAQMKPEQQTDLQKVLEKPKSMEQIAQWLKSQNIKYKGANSVRAAEQMPPEYLNRISKLQDGQIGSLRSNDSVMLVRMLGSQPQAVNEAQAKPAIERLLANQKRTELANAELKRVQSESKVAYLGAFSDLGKEISTVAQSAPPPPAAATTESEKLEAEKSGAQPLSTESLSKGLSGLK